MMNTKRDDAASAATDCSAAVWQSYDDFSALSGDVVLRRWKSRETGRLKYALIECWKTIDDYLPDNEFLMIDDGGDSDAGLRAMDYWSR